MKKRYTMIMLWRCALLICFLSCTGVYAQATKHGNAHNDYRHQRPLYEALEAGFRSIEVDVFLVQDQLKVAHTFADLQQAQDICTLYLDPLDSIVKLHQGAVYQADSLQIILMIDCKSEGREIYQALKPIIDRYPGLFRRGGKAPVKILLSGNKPYKEVLSDDQGIISIDGDIEEASSKEYSRIITRCSAAWSRYFRWRGKGKMPEREKKKLLGLVKKVHDAGKTIRFWAIPDNPAVWKQLREAGVDWINTDKLEEYRLFELKQ